MCDVVAGTPERLLSANLAAELLVAIVGIRDVWRGHQGLATAPPHLVIDALDAEEPKAAAGHHVGPQALFSLPLFHRILNARLRAIVLVVAAAVVANA